MKHISEFFALFGGGVQDAGWEGTPKLSRARVIDAYLEKLTSKATQFDP